jgi:hypothetical protein
VQHLMDPSVEEPATTGRQRALFVGVALLVTGALAALVFVLGTIAYVVRFQGDHEARLARVMKQKPTVQQITQAMENEGSPLLAAPATPSEIEQAAERWGTRDRAAILALGARWPTTRVFDAHGMRYFIFFDERGIMRAFVCSRP